MKNCLQTIGFCLVTLFCFAQKSVLDKPVTVRVANERLEETLKMIGDKNGFSFSYNPSDFDVNRRVSLNASGTVSYTHLDVYKRQA